MPGSIHAVAMFGIFDTFTQEFVFGVAAHSSAESARKAATRLNAAVAVAQRLFRISGDTERGFAAIAHARPGLPTAWLPP
jgi:hypothetical protein